MIKHGIEQLREDDFRLLQGKRVGLMTNPSAVDRKLTSTYEIFATAPEVDLTALYGPEHGMIAAALDAIAVEDRFDPATGVPIYSLYGKTVRPTTAMLENIDVMVCDIQDIGLRFYTYVWTVSYLLEACGEHGIDVVILDRPNPLGDRVAGGPLDEKFSSFVGRFNIPVQHGMTLGELAQMMNALWNPTPANLTVVPCFGWERHTTWDQTGLEFVTTSPAIPYFRTVLQYPGACFIEGTMLSEGRGTSLPFEVVGAPYINGNQLASDLNSLNLDGVIFRPHAFFPTASKFRDETCYGVQGHLTDPRAFDPIPVWLTVIHTIRHTYADQFEWLPPHQQEYERGSIYHFDRLIGSEKPRQQIDAGQSIAEVMAGWDAYCDAFREQRAPYLIDVYE